MISPCGPLSQPIAGISRLVRPRPTHHILSHRIRHAVHVGRHAHAVVASGCRVVAPLAAGIVLGVLPPASAFHRPMVPPPAIQQELPADPAAETGSSAPELSPGLSLRDPPFDPWPATTPTASFLATVASSGPGIPIPAPTTDLIPSPYLPGWSDPNGIDPPVQVLPQAGGPTPGGPPDLSQPATSVPVPEPPSVVILGAGLFGLLILSGGRRGIAAAAG